MKNSLFAIRESRIKVLSCQKYRIMKKHSGMRPHDIAVLLKIATKGGGDWLMKDLSYELGISASEISESMNRSVIAGLIAPDKKRLMKAALLDFLEFGLRYVYPQQAGALVRGFPTAHSAPPLNEIIVSEEQFVWPFAGGKVRGQAVEPLHPKLPEASLKDPDFYQMMALCDALRVGKVREKNIAMEELKKRI
jgi:predicted transcriptional regulator